jgi:DNA topoisomerase VI subunit B
LTTSRLLDFCSEKELTAQTGHPRREWPLVILKELVDNALDACEESGVPPEVTVRVDTDGSITVTDNGPGLPADTVAGVLDFGKRISSREHYVSPTRGAQGNALKTIIAMPFVLSGRQEGRVEIAARGVRHAITLRVDAIRQEPVIGHQPVDDRFVKNGTSVTVREACSPAETGLRFLQIVEDFTFLNPHLTLTLERPDQPPVRWAATDPHWKKWLPSDPTSIHWYTAERFERLVCGYLAHDFDRGQDRTVRELVVEFDGLTGSVKPKAVLESTGLSRKRLSDLRSGDGLNRERVAGLLAAMQSAAKPVKPQALGVIGRDHVAKRFAELRCEGESFNYQKQLSVGTDGLPFVGETAFAWAPKTGGRRLIAGVNGSPGIGDPFKQIGAGGRSLSALLEAQYADGDAPVAFLLHIACPRVQFTDRGKGSVVIGDDDGSGVTAEEEE